MKIKTKKMIKTIHPVEIVKREFRGRLCYEFTDKYGQLYRIVIPIFTQKKG